MTNPHARLTAALAEHYPNARELRCSCGWQLPAHLSTFGNNFTAHLASVITSLEGVAVVGLPDWQLHGVRVDDEVVYDADGNCYSPDGARALAATLLAAADHVDRLARAAEGGR